LEVVEKVGLFESGENETNLCREAMTVVRVTMIDNCA